MSSLGIHRRLRRLQGPDGRFLLFAADHGLPAGPLPALEDPRAVLTALAGSPVTGVILNPGTVRSIPAVLSRAGLVVHLSAGTVLAKAPTSEVLDDAHVDLIQLVAPSTHDERAREIGAASRGFLYVVARYGTTGTRSDLPSDLAQRLASLRRGTSLPLAVGFGVSTADHVRALASLGADGVVVGSAIVSRVAESADPAAVESFVGGLAAGLRG